jgi:short-chain fatty acids transporter
MKTSARSSKESLGPIARVALVFTDWTERWIPDAFIFALLATFIVVVAALILGQQSISGVVEIWGNGFWDLLPFTLQMSLVIITGYVVAVAPFMNRVIGFLASLPKTPRAGVAFVAFFAMMTSWLNWGFSLIFSAVLAKAVARRLPKIDYRAVAASAFLGLGSIWAQGLSGSAALQMATPSALPVGIRKIVEAGSIIPNGVIPLRNTIFLWQSFFSVVVEVLVVTAVVYFASPSGTQVKTAIDLGVDLRIQPEVQEMKRGVPGEWLEHSPLLTFLFVALAGLYLGHTFVKSGGGLNSLNLNFLNLFLLTVGAVLHRTPARFMRAVKDATPAVWGVILQFPFYAGIAALIVHTHLNDQLAHLFVRISTPTTFPVIVSMYSTILGVFVPSGGSKWVIEAPYVLQAAHDLKVHLGWVVTAYDLGEALANLLQPFWMLPILGVLGLKAKDIMGYTFLIFLVLAPVVFLLLAVLGKTLSYPL